MFAVRVEGRGAIGLTGAQERQADHEVEHGSGGRQKKAQTWLLERLKMNEAVGGGPENHASGNKDERAFKQRGDVLGLAVAEVVVLVRGLDGDAQRNEACDGGDEVDDGFEGIGKKTHGTGEPRGEGLQQNRRDGGGDRQLHKPLEGGLFGTINGGHSDESLRFGRA